MPDRANQNTTSGAATDKRAISLIVPVHNTAEWLTRCFDSIDAQTFKDFELIVVDDASSDNSPALIDNYVSLHPGALKLTHGSCRGLSAARNTGIAAAQGSYLAFLDSDDWLEPCFLEALYFAVSSTGSQVAQIEYGQSFKEESFDQPAHVEVKVLQGVDAACDMLERDEYSVWCRLYETSLLKSLGDAPFVEGLTCEDRVFNMQILPKSTKVAQSNSLAYHYFQNLGSLSLGGLTKRGLDLLEADSRMVAAAKATGDSRLFELAKDRQAKGAYSLLVKWARFGITDSSFGEEEASKAVRELQTRYVEDYPRLMKSHLSAPKRFVAWELRYCPALLKAEFAVYNCVKGVNRNKEAQ